MMRPTLGVCSLALVTVLAACATADQPESIEQELTTAGKASISLANSSATVTQTSDTSWTLDKQGSVDTSNSTVTWTVTATRGVTVGGQLVVNGFMAVTNTGSGGATIGNIVVNLQTRVGNKWVTRSADVANATDGDAATTANVVKSASSEALSSFTENAASGSLNFMDATTNTVFSLVPQQVIAPGATVNLLFSAAFDNTVLNLPVGTPIRAEVIVTFGNSGGTNNNNTAPNIDINGNGTIDADEARVRSVPTRLGLTVPATQQGNIAVVLTDTIDDIATTGTVTVTSSSFNLGATTGTVTVGYNAGASGGTITNCAHLDSASTSTSVGAFTFPTVNGVDLDACNTQTIAGPGPCTPGVGTCGWVTGSMTTYTQLAWGNPFATNPTLFGGYDTVYGNSVVEVGIPGSGGFSMAFTLPLAVSEYLPASGAPAPLNADLVNPTTTASGVLGGEVLGLQLNVDFADAGLTTGTSAFAFGDLTLCNLGAAVDGTSVRDFLARANTALGGGTTSGISLLGYVSVASQLNNAFTLGAPSLFAQTSLRIGPCP